MSFLDTLSASLADKAISKHEFLLCYNSHEKIIHAFFEGKTDESFYGTFLRAKTPSEWLLKTYICNNKDGVYYNFNQHKKLHSNTSILLFFVDKDIEDLIPYPRLENENIYVTDYYSVENYVVTTDCIERVWAEIFRQGSGSIVAQELSSSFSAALLVAHDILLDMMSWILFHRRIKNRPNLDCIQTKELFSINQDLIVKREFTDEKMYDYLDCKTKLTTDKSEQSKIRSLKIELCSYEPKAVIRGHNEMDFFIEFYKKLKSVAANQSKNKIKPLPDITSSNVLDILGPRTPIPESLNIFLDHHLCNI